MRFRNRPYLSSRLAGTRKNMLRTECMRLTSLGHGLDMRGNKACSEWNIVVERPGPPPSEN